MTDHEIKDKDNQKQADDDSSPLSPLRGEIDRIDERILELINQRLEIGKKVGEIKKQKGSQILDRTRERMVIERLSRLNPGPADESLIQYIFNVIITATREIQKPKSIGYLGPLASHSHIAALHYFNHCGEFVEQAGFLIFSTISSEKSCISALFPLKTPLKGLSTIPLIFLPSLILKLRQSIMSLFPMICYPSQGNSKTLKPFIPIPRPLPSAKTG